MPRRGPLSGLFAPRQAEPAEPPEVTLRRFVAEDRRVKDAVAALCRKWRAAGHPSSGYAAQLEAAMGWDQPGDPLTGCRPVTPD